MPWGVRRSALPRVGRLGLCALTTLLAVSLLTGCESRVAAQPSELETQEPEPFVYVALGDSYTAAHGVPGTNWRDPCLQSDINYPHLVAADLPDATLVDVSCSGTATQHMTRERTVGTDTYPPQFDALSHDTDLVTVSIGYNDFRLFSTLFGRCVQMAEKDPEGSPCRDRLVRPSGFDSLAKRVEIIGRRVARVVDGIREAAPEARIMVVSYPHLLPETGYCLRRVPLGKGDYPYVRGINDMMSDAQRAAIEGVEGAEYVDVAGASVGHDVCSDDPWIAGIDPDVTRAAAYHPFAIEQRAVADLILDQL
jgi:lysophospholipase L1-like esterase